MGSAAGENRFGRGAANDNRTSPDGVKFQWERGLSAVSGLFAVCLYVMIHKCCGTTVSNQEYKAD